MRRFLSILSTAFMITLSAILLSIIALRCFFFPIEVSGSSMDKTLYSSELLIVQKTKNVARGDIVIIKVPERLDSSFSGELLVKRVVAVAGDTFYVYNNIFYLKTAEEETFHIIEEPYISSKTPNIAMTVLEDNEIYCLGDNRAISKDSSEVGPFSTEDIQGIVLNRFMEESKLKSFLLFIL